MAKKSKRKNKSYSNKNTIYNVPTFYIVASQDIHKTAQQVFGNTGYLSYQSLTSTK
jgi:hypothetical protein